MIAKLLWIGLLLLVGLIAPLQGRGEREDTWLQLGRDPGHTGLSPQPLPGLPLRVRWKAGPMPGPVAPVPPILVAGGRVYFAVSERGAGGQTTGAVYALDQRTGARLWRVQFGGIYPPNIAADENSLYVWNEDGQLLALNPTTGRTRWQVGLPRYRDLGTSLGIAPDQIIVGAWLSEPLIYSLRKQDGTVHWIFPLGRRAHSPLGAPSYAYGMVFLSAFDKTLYVIDATSGKLLWSVDHDHPGSWGTTVAGRYILIPGSGMGQVATKGAATVSAFDRVGRTRMWSFVVDPLEPCRTPSEDEAAQRKRPTSSASGIAVAHSRVFFGIQEGRDDFHPDDVFHCAFFYALDLASGKLLWKFQADNDIYTHPIVAGNLVLFGTINGTLYALDTATGQVRWQEKLSGAIRSHPALAGGLLFVGTDDGFLYAFGP